MPELPEVEVLVRYLEPALKTKLLAGLGGSIQPIKVKLLDQSLVVGVGNIYASEALFRAQISPALPARQLTLAQAKRLRSAIRSVLREAIRFGSTVPLDWTVTPPADNHFYYGRAPEAVDYYEEKLRVYDRAGKPCRRCGTGIRRLVQVGRSTFYCPACQPRRGSPARRSNPKPPSV